MMIMPGPGVLNVMIRDRQKKLRANGHGHASRRAPSTMRVRVGRALIVAGSTLSGERVEQPARPPAALCRAA
jgi:hypothetical protein